jgi:hypothetical protein
MILEPSMSRCFVASTVLALALSLPAVALADVPPADGGAAVTSDCTAALQARAGSSCAECMVTGSNTSCQVELGHDYNFVCNQSPTVQIWCNGPDRLMTDNAACALGGSPVPVRPAGAAVAALLGIAAWALRRRK